MSALDDAFGLDFYLVRKHLRSLRVLAGSARTDYLMAVEVDDGHAVRRLVERALLETAAQEGGSHAQVAE